VIDENQHDGDGAEAVDFGPVLRRRQGQWRANPGSRERLAVSPPAALFSSRSATVCHLLPESAVESRFSEAAESDFGRLEKALKTTIYSIACG
jgi:hypothetical protein